ncbi:MAG: hypothetical protein ACYC4U_29085 [Pirellulaceae bacterium]
MSKVQMSTIKTRPWLIATVTLCLLLGIVTFLYHRERTVSRIHAEAARHYFEEIQNLRNATNDTKGFLSWYRWNRDDGIDADSLADNLHILQNKYAVYFPLWFESLALDKPSSKHMSDLQ